MVWDKEKIKSILPHREPFLFIDEVVEIDGTEKVVALKHVDENESYFEGHFPGNPLMPGVLLVEAMAQSSIILFAVVKPDIVRADPNYYLGKVNSEFLSPVYPGDTVMLEAGNVKILDYAAITENVAKVNDTVVAKASFVFSVQKK
jgi:3-hydroxyacyl-[acyl-carrier-protein] dehydratase